MPAEDLAAAVHLRYTDDPAALRACRVFIVTVPTPVDRYNRPDLTPLVSASQTVGAALKPGDVVIYESTVYPGATEEVCVPVLERVSGLAFNQKCASGVCTGLGYVGLPLAMEFGKRRPVLGYVSLPGLCDAAAP